MDRLSYFGIILRCPKCETEYSPRLKLCPSCDERISHKKRRELLNREKASRIVEAFKLKVITPENLFYYVYQRRPTRHKFSNLKDKFVGKVLKNLEIEGYLKQEATGFLVVEVPSADDVYEIMWGKANISKKVNVEKPVAKKIHYVNAVKGDGCWYQKKNNRVKGKIQRFFLINSPDSVKRAREIALQHPHQKYNFDFTNGYRPTLERLDDLLLNIPNVGILACSEYTWIKRLKLKLTELFTMLIIPRGGRKLWVDNAYLLVNQLLDIGESLGTICKKLNMFGIQISVQGLLKYRWKYIKGPPPVFVW